MDEIEEFLEALDIRRGKQNVIRAAESLAQVDGGFDFLVSEMKHANPRRRGSISWILSYACEHKIWQGTSHQDSLIDLLSDGKNSDMSKRCLLHIFEKMNLDSVRLGELLDLCIQFMMDPKEALACKAFSITVASRIEKYYPELGNELEPMFRSLLSHDHYSIQCRAQRALDAMKKKKWKAR